MTAPTNVRVQRWADSMIAQACQRLPAAVREERIAEWCAETAAILHDPCVRMAARRGVRALRFALGVAWAARLERAASSAEKGAPKPSKLDIAAVAILLTAGVYTLSDAPRSITVGMRLTFVITAGLYWTAWRILGGQSRIRLGPREMEMLSAWMPENLRQVGAKTTDAAEP